MDETLLDSAETELNNIMQQHHDAIKKIKRQNDKVKMKKLGEKFLKNVFKITECAPALTGFKSLCNEFYSTGAVHEIYTQKFDLTFDSVKCYIYVRNEHQEGSSWQNVQFQLLTLEMKRKV